ncbi:hypothetical protein CHLRE_11g482676v5 [Chlamydomonas reinhardtii]|uniref:Uncharacterized protein n=1 Tax=Chlamydomonas reinhardtii TaxID=3055 RepID=A0A2K3D8V7_CHLRE|nr:uncharacterized protein CHLRE_11g482676v5 [Chlamydomonas reinhardtii]PNW76957.1 hypothetical protein CHLRE_11g482676v5 [Chlamydomonas reinhardtii]
MAQSPGGMPPAEEETLMQAWLALDGETHQVHEGGGTGTALPATATASASASAAASSSSCNTSGAALRRLGLQSCVGCRWQRLMGPTAAGGW